MKRLLCVPLAKIPCGARHLNIHEHSAKGLLREFGVRTEFGVVVTNLDDVRAACAKIKTNKKVVKSQILAGGRGKGTFVDGFKGGVHIANGVEEAVQYATKMLNNTLVTKQNGPSGQKVTTLFITEAISNIKRELYVALVLDRKTASPTFIGCSEGGMGIEELAHSSPDKIKKLPIDIHNGIDEEACIKFAVQLGFQDAVAVDCAKELINIYNLAKAKDCTMVEINPLAELTDGTVIALDAKLSFDDNAQFRRPEIWALEDKSQKDPKEVLADEAELNYIALNGTVGCLVNGAGLAMATMDLISLYGESPANFLDVGGSAKAEQIIRAFEIITSDPSVRCILVNIFGGIMKCDVIAIGIVEAVKHFKAKNLPIPPLVVRLKGTNEDLGKKILKDSGLTIHPVDDLDDAGKTAARLVKESKAGK